MVTKRNDTRPIAEIVPYPGNARTHSDEQIDQIAASMLEFGWTIPVLLDEQGGLIAGHGRISAAERIYAAGKAIRGLDGNWLPEGHAPIMVAKGWSDAKKRAYVIADNSLALNAGWDDEILRSEIEALSAEEFNLDLLGFDDASLNEILGRGPADDDNDPEPSRAGNLAERFGIAPFSVLNAREGWWQDRKRAWLSLGIQSEIGRGEDAADDKHNGGVLMPSHTTGDPSFYAKKRAKERELGRELTTDEFLTQHYVPSDRATATGTSIFDPVLCELAYRWFCPAEGLVLDPFAGGSVRGVVASRLGRAYHGIDLRPEQVEANRAQAETICAGFPAPAWVAGDSLVEADSAPAADFIFSCPPYADLEVYSDDPRDLSTMGYVGFVKIYREIIAKACARLQEHRFACFVVGDVRDGKGAYRNFVGDTVEAFRAAGLRYYNEAILVTAAGSLPLRAGKQFSSTRKLGKTHQNVLVFVKGDPRKATLACGDVEFGEIEDLADAA